MVDKIVSIESLLFREEVQKEYRKTLLLNMFKKLVQAMNSDTGYRNKIKKLYSQSVNPIETTSIIFKKKYSLLLEDSDSNLVHSWIVAYFKKALKRKTISIDVKMQLLKQQNGKCAVCGKELGNDFSRIHVDHVIPWVLVGDELDNNYQVLCDFCNECKSSRTDYVFKHLIHLI